MSRPLLLLSALAALAACAGSPDPDLAGMRAVRDQLRRLDRAVERYRSERGALPATLDDLREPTEERPDGYVENLPVDAWGESYVYTAGEDRFVLFSRGPDRTEGTADDIVLAAED